MKLKFAAMFVSLAALAVACSSSKSGTSSGTGGEGGDTTTTASTNPSTTGSSMGTGTGTGGAGMGGMGGAGGGGGAGMTCDNSGNCNTCTSCSQKMGAPCQKAAADFQAAPNAMTFYACVTPCGQKPQAEQKACVDACCTPNQEACKAYQTFVTCVICDACYTDCMGAQAGCPPKP